MSFLRPSRRSFIGGVGATAAAAGLAGLLPEGAAEAVAAAKGRGSIDDIEHVVILMQENRSFDHYYGTMRGVRGFGDPTLPVLPGGQDVLHQPDPLRTDGGYLLPFHVDTTKSDGQDLGDLAHDWDTTHLAWNGGRYDQWVTAKTAMTMSYFTQGDIPYHRALAAAFTLCDSYHCSIQGPTTPNRLYHWTGMIDPLGRAGGPATANPPDYQPVFSWTTYPERLQRAGISWQVYANDEVGDGSDGYVGDYGDNPLWLFHAYHDALASTDPRVRQLAERASLRTTWKPDSGKGKDISHVIAQFAADCASGKLPAVSWVVAPYQYSEHPAARPVDGEAYVDQVLQALWKNPELWAKTVVLLNYDENDGFYDHVPPPVPPAGTPAEFLPAVQPAYGGLPPAAGPPTPIGLGPRVPMTVVSPWSHGGWLNSQVFDHTSVLRFLETWTGVREDNISAWRRSICGDLTSCFDFGSPSTTIPTLPNTAALRTAADRNQSTLPPPMPPDPGQQVRPVQDGGYLLARALPYQSLANLSTSGGPANLVLANHGTVSFPFAVTDQPAGAPVPHDVRPGTSTTVAVAELLGHYDVTVHGPNGFLLRATGANSDPVSVTLDLAGASSHRQLQLTVRNRGAAGQSVTVDSLDGHRATVVVSGNSHRTLTFDPLRDHRGWYDLTITGAGMGRRYAGHLENGLPSRTR